MKKDGEQVLEKVKQTESFDQRAETAQVCATSLNLSLPTLVDKADNKVNQAYAGWPDRMAVVGIDGKIAYYGGPGPRGFKPSEVEQWLKQHVAGR